MKRVVARLQQFALCGTVGFLIAISGLGDSSAQVPAVSEWKPSRNVEIIVAASVGGGLDRTSRVAQQLMQELRLVPTSVAVINKPGGGGTIGWTYLSQFPGDGHYISIASPTLLTNHIAGRSRYSHKDFTNIALLFSEYITFATRAESPIKNVRGLLERLKDDPASVTFAVSPAFGGANHIAIAALAKAAGMDIKRMKVVNFNSAGEATSMMLGGHVDVNVSVASNVAGQMQAGRARVLGITAPQRLSGIFAGTPTLSELGFDVNVVNWRAVIGPSGLPPGQVAFWVDVFETLSQSPAWRRELEKRYWGATFMPPGAVAKYMDREYERLRAVLSELGLAQ